MKAGMSEARSRSAQQQPHPEKKPEAKAVAHEDDVVGKAYDSRLMRRLLTYLRPYKWQAGVSLVAILLKSLADISGPYLTKVAVDRYMTRETAAAARVSWLGRHLSDSPAAGITQIALLYIGLLCLSYVLEFTQTYLMQWTGQKIMYDMRSEIFRHLQRMHVAFFDRNPVGRLVTRLTSDVDALNEMFTSGVFAIFEDIFVLLGIVLVMLRMNWWLALVAFAVLPVIVLITRLFRTSVRDSYRRIRSAIARINAFTQEHVTGMSVVQLFGREQRAYQDFEAVNRTHMDAFKDAIMAYALYYPAVELLSSIAIALVIWIGGRGVLRGAVTIGVLVAFIQYAQRFFRPIQDLSDKYNILQAAMAASERVFKLLDTDAEVTSPAEPVPSPRAGRIEFRNVWFTYERLSLDQLAAIDNAEPAELEAMGIEWILRGVSFTVEPNETAAIVGHTGAGKTTIISLMMRFYDVQRGQVLIDGIDVREHDLTELRKHFGVVLQDPFLFTGTIAENIRMGTSSITPEEMERAADEVNVADFIRTLPRGFDEPLRERGAGLSTGQKQLINFARALAHRPRILILDEATSSVDTETEMRVRTALDRMVTGRTSVVIAHRLSTVQRADTILVMHKGQLREHGPHQQLLAQRGIYWKLYRLQYRDQEAEAASAAIANAPLALGTD
ncbi:MAG: ATP-binding cassette, subfamily multidrug efflux pump [Acidobacteriaceae bacterium]|nr:ATP-binding cassette, subfamily multidrug efflux pump [Acidobacteriaceae bacterium]